MIVLVNGRDEQVPAGASVGEVVALLVERERGVAVAVNGDVVPRSTWNVHSLAPGDRIEVVTAVGGG